LLLGAWSKQVKLLLHIPSSLRLRGEPLTKRVSLWHSITCELFIWQVCLI